ncbi:MAG: archaemetzincin family Zn-dependent metalloprotease [Nitrososphaeraceae archaeon]|nr:archaemetzincin family Zn-dependent metalloprotease [Nitrososphaeraceae archaeon]MBV9666744.1 archaemetzincin family Zn-dependent metalloprotease [Nitrososphaeraceae archaeon]
MQIILQPVLFQLGERFTSTLVKVLSKEFNSSVSSASLITEIPVQLFDKQRNQWKSNEILQWLLDKRRPNRATTKILAICDFDAYSNHLNFVFGEAYLDGSISAIYLSRLRQEFYVLKADEYLFYQRIVKEAVHELGHAFGMNHCRNTSCVMHFSNSLSDTDIKESQFCNVCKGIIGNLHPWQQ